MLFLCASKLKPRAVFSLCTHSKCIAPSPNPSRYYLHLGYSLCDLAPEKEIGHEEVGEALSKYLSNPNLKP